MQMQTHLLQKQTGKMAVKRKRDGAADENCDKFDMGEYIKIVIGRALV